MERRTVFRAGLAAALGIFGASRAAAAPAAGKQRVVYHLDDPEKVAFVMSNIQNHVAGTGGPGGADIRLVVHGPALKNFHALVADENFTQLVDKIKKQGVGMDACANTMRVQGVKLDDLLPGFGVAEKGGVVRLAELQHEGYAYIRP